MVLRTSEKVKFFLLKMKDLNPEIRINPEVFYTCTLEPILLCVCVCCFFLNIHFQNSDYVYLVQSTNCLIVTQIYAE